MSFGRPIKSILLYSRFLSTTSNAALRSRLPSTKFSLLSSALDIIDCNARPAVLALWQCSNVTWSNVTTGHIEQMFSSKWNRALQSQISNAYKIYFVWSDARGRCWVFGLAAIPFLCSSLLLHQFYLSRVHFKIGESTLSCY